MIKDLFKKAAVTAVGVMMLTTGAQASVNPYGVIFDGVKSNLGTMIVSPQIEANFDQAAKQSGPALLEQGKRLDGGDFIKSSRVEFVPGKDRTYRITTIVTDSGSAGFVQEISIARFFGSGQKGDPVRLGETAEGTVFTPNMQKFWTNRAP